MNALDRIIAYIDPDAAVKREAARRTLKIVQNSGYSNYGASRTKKALKGWIDTGGSAIEDIHMNLDTLRDRSRDLSMGVPLANGALKTYRTNVIGSGLTPKPTLDAEALGMTEEQAGELEKQISREFNIWADNVNCDAERYSTFYELQQLAFLSWLMNGDVFAVLQMRERLGSEYALCVQLIEADRVCTPGSIDGLETDDRIVGGVEVNQGGAVVAYHIAKRHPKSVLSTQKQEWVRVPAFGRKTGRRNILHCMIRERVGQRRGVPMLAPVIESLKQLGRYTDAELIAAVVSGYISVFIQKKEESDDLPIGEAQQPSEFLVDAGDKNSIEWGPGSLIDLAPGEEANSVTPGRPNSNFDGFVASISKQIGAALELPYELLVKQFTASYSASRAALMEGWKSFDMWRDWMVEKFCQPIYEEWLTEAVARGKINIPGFLNDPSMRKLICNAQWYGPAQGQLDPVKEVQAAADRVANGFSTHSREAMELTGTDFVDNVRMIKREQQLMQDAIQQSAERQGTKQGAEEETKTEEGDEEDEQEG